MLSVVISGRFHPIKFFAPHDEGLLYGRIYPKLNKWKMVCKKKMENVLQYIWDLVQTVHISFNTSLSIFFTDHFSFDRVDNVDTVALSSSSFIEITSDKFGFEPFKAVSHFYVLFFDPSHSINTNTSLHKTPIPAYMYTPLPLNHSII